VNLAFPATMAAFGPAFDDLRVALDAQPLDPGARFNVELVFEEIVANIVRHGAPPGRTAAIRVSFAVEPDVLVMTFEDDGIAFDPRRRPDPVPAKSLDEAEEGGLGLMMVRRAASALDYERTAGGLNRLVVRLPAYSGRRAD